MIGRIVRSADFERVLGKPSRARSAHFAVHHLAASPSLPAKLTRALSTADGELSTGDPQFTHNPVDELPPEAAWLGVVVPKRHAKRSVTRSLLKRQIRAAFDQQPLLPPGLWVVRLRSPFDRKQFPSASSDALRLAARTELAQLVGRVLSARPKA
ncbi:ribonuclease P protein component [Roseateles koreensis]|uniref:Ribonuclease P protein component n=1 Tax=Roseateles koreensis TaxID=2987526 RepID=A0ABT5KRW7_9BURK|nr:ribonuclease P protein component [Roseateles koreensis]MDC8785592.1 ribonuclease P protein component [Roseateles koreensis]